MEIQIDPVKRLSDALSHTLDNRTQGLGFVGMTKNDITLMLRTWLSKHYKHVVKCNGLW